MKQVLIIIGSIVAIMAIIIGVLVMSNEHSNNTPKVASTTDCQSAPKDTSTTKTTSDGLKINDTTTGTGTAATASSTVTVEYTGTLCDGTVFDSTAKQGGTPATFPLSNVIVGWQEGIPGMKVGGTRTLVIPPALAYGASAQNGIPANSTLIFTIKLVDVK